MSWSFIKLHWSKDVHKFWNIFYKTFLFFSFFTCDSNLAYCSSYSSQKPIRNLVKHFRWCFLQIVIIFQSLTIFTENPCLTGLWMRHRFTCFMDLFYFLVFKASVRYFLSNFIFHQMIALQKPFHLKCSLRSWNIQIFPFLTSPLFLPVSHCFRGWSKINLKVYGIINCLRKNLITHFVRYLEKEKRYDVEALFIDRVLNKDYFHRKIMQKMRAKS